MLCGATLLLRALCLPTSASLYMLHTWPAHEQQPQAFIYLLCQVGIRPVVSKLLGWGPSRAMNSITSMPPPSEQLAKMK